MSPSLVLPRSLATYFGRLKWENTLEECHHSTVTNYLAHHSIGRYCGMSANYACWGSIEAYQSGLTLTHFISSGLY